MAVFCMMLFIPAENLYAQSGQGLSDATGPGLARPGDETIVLGGSDEWARLTQANNVSLVEGFRGSSDIVLRDNEYSVDARTELLLHFNDERARDATGRYTYSGGPVRLTELYARLGSGAVVLQNEIGPLTYTASPGSLFYPGTHWSSFSIDFWMYSATLGEGETVLEWNGSRIDTERPRPQEVLISVSERRLVWRFENFFVPPDRGDFTIQLTGRDGLIPREWSHHLLRYDARTGMLEYQVNGVPQDIAYTTPSGREAGSVYLPYVGTASGLSVRIGPGFAGFLDEFRMSRAFVEDPNLDEVVSDVGTIVTDILDLSYPGSRLLSIDATDSNPGNTDIAYYYRLGTRRNSLTEVAAPWRRFSPGQAIDETGQYLQVRADLLPDGTGAHSPHLSELRIHYRPDIPPAPPLRVNARPGDALISVEWSVVPEADVSGYLVFYGHAPGEYFGTEAVEGVSPVDAGQSRSITLSGLENGRLYYIAVASYDESGVLQQSRLSREVVARPLGDPR